MNFKEFFSSMSPRNRAIIIVEIGVGILILIGGVFLLATEGRAPMQSATPMPSMSTYVSSPLQVTFKYPGGWQIDPAFNGIPGIERYQSVDGPPAQVGYFQIDATNDPTKRAGRLIIKYPKPIKLGTTTYRYFVLYADAEHLKSIGDTVEFMNTK